MKREPGWWIWPVLVVVGAVKVVVLVLMCSVLIYAVACAV